MEITKFIVSECGNSPEHAFSRAVEIAKADEIFLELRKPIANKEGSRLVMYTSDHSADPIEMLAESYLQTVGQKHFTDKVGYINQGEGEFVFFGYTFGGQNKFIKSTNK